MAQISEQIFSSKDTVRRGLERFGITVREAHRPHGRPAQPRFGQKIRNGKVEAYQAEKKVVDAITGLKSQGMGLRQIARTMSQLGIPTKCRGRAWHPEMVRRILDGPA